MRLIGTLDTILHAKLCGANLSLKGIENTIEGNSVWVLNEDQLAEAIGFLEKFQKNPSDPEFDVPVIDKVPDEIVLDDDIVVREPPSESPEVTELLTPRRTGQLTAFFIAFCTLIYFLSAMQEVPMLEKGIPPNVFVPTPVQTMMLFDIPPVVEELEKMIAAYNPPLDKQPSPLPVQIQDQIKAVNTTPFWRGAADLILLKIKGADLSAAEGPLFGKIRQGEFWRLLSPIFLHGSILHILFNMLWLWVLGKQVEQRTGVLRYLLLTIFIGVFANVVQYLASGPFFLGYSGVILGLAGFIWSREKVAPWEGYPLPRSMILFLILFVLAMFLLEAVSVVLAILSMTTFEPNVANMAHIAGAILGALLGRLKFFAARPPA